MYYYFAGFIYLATYCFKAFLASIIDIVCLAMISVAAYYISINYSLQFLTFTKSQIRNMAQVQTKARPYPSH